MYSEPDTELNAVDVDSGSFAQIGTWSEDLWQDKSGTFRYQAAIIQCACLSYPRPTP